MEAIVSFCCTHVWYLVRWLFSRNGRNRLDCCVHCLGMCVCLVCVFVNQLATFRASNSINFYLRQRKHTHTESSHWWRRWSSELRRKRMKRKKKTRRQTRLLLNSSRIRCGKFTYDRPAAGRFTFIFFFFFFGPTKKPTDTNYTQFIQWTWKSNN